VGFAQNPDLHGLLGYVVHKSPSPALNSGRVNNILIIKSGEVLYLSLQTAFFVPNIPNFFFVPLFFSPATPIPTWLVTATFFPLPCLFYVEKKSCPS
jgi:hypothetical protein